MAAKPNDAQGNNQDTPPDLVLRDPKGMRVTATEFLDDSYRHPIGMTTMLVGDGGLGKSLYSILLAARVTRSGYGVVFATAEDDANKTWLPRLIAAGVSLPLVRLARIEYRSLGLTWDQSVDLPDHLVALRRAIAAFRAEAGCDVRLLVIDPLEAHLGDTTDDGNSSTRRRQALAPIEAFANDEQLHVLAVHHINKDSSQRASHRVLGTVANRNAPRSMLIFGTDPANESERVLYHDKHNVSPKSPTQVYAIEATTVRGDDGVVASTARLRYVRDTDIDPETIFGKQRDDEEDGASALDEACEFLAGELAFGPKAVNAVNRAADGLGISRITLKRARKRLGVESYRTGGLGDAGTWMLKLPVYDDESGAE